LEIREQGEKPICNRFVTVFRNKSMVKAALSHLARAMVNMFIMPGAKSEAFGARLFFSHAPARAGKQERSDDKTRKRIRALARVSTRYTRTVHAPVTFV